MEPSKEAIAVRITRLNRQILGKVIGVTNILNKRVLDRETLLDALTVLYDECNDDPVKKSDDWVRAFVDKYRSTLAELRRMRVCLSDFDMLQSIGRGQFGEVHMVREKETGDVYAMKTLRKEESRKRVAGAADDERDVLANANSPWIPKLQFAFQDNSHLYLVMELCLGGDLAGLLSRRNHPLAEKDAAFYVAEVAHALKALHAMGYVHRDVKPHNILLDRCGHVKLGDLGSCARLSAESCGGAAPATADYVAPELLAAAACADTHAVCLQYCRGIVSASISAVDYWSLGVVAFELVTLRRPFSEGDEDSVAKVLSNIQKYEQSSDPELPFEVPPDGPSSSWRALVAGLLRVPPARRYTYLDTLRHPALAAVAPHNIRDQVPPWVPLVRGAEDASHLRSAPRRPRPPDAAPFRARPPFSGQLPFVGYSYVAPEDNEESTISSGFNASHDCTAIDLATFKSAEKLAAMRGRELASLQDKLAASEAAASAAAERTRRDADAEAERTRARLQAEITALSLQTRRLERQIEVEKEERMALQRTNQELNCRISERNIAALAEMERERNELKEEIRKAEDRANQLQEECTRALAAADSARLHRQHYKDTIAKERALRRQTLSGGDENREAAARLAAAEASLAREGRARAEADSRLCALQADHTTLRAQHHALATDNATLQQLLDDTRRDLKEHKNSFNDRQRVVDSTSDQLKTTEQELAQERVRVTSLLAQIQELERSMEDAARRESALEEQCVRTEARLQARLEDAETRATAALQDDTRHREKVNTLEQLVRRLEREVSALERRVCPDCAARPDRHRPDRSHRDQQKNDISVPKTTSTETYSDTESVGDTAHVASAQLTLLKEQLERAEASLQTRADEIASLKQEARSANLARWRKEKEYSDLSLEAKSTARELKRVEERLSAAMEAKKAAEQRAATLQSEMAVLKPQHERASKDAQRIREQFERLQKVHETAQAEVDRSRNDIRKLKSELAYSEKRRLHAEEQEELSSRERALMRDELTQLRGRATELDQNNMALQEACSLLEEQLTDLEKLADHHELKNKDLENELLRVRNELSSCRTRLTDAERQSTQRASDLSDVARQHEEAREQAAHAQCQIKLLQERLDNRETLAIELEARFAELESANLARQAALAAAARRVRDLQEECAALRTRAHQHHALALQLQGSLAEAQEELSSARESAAAAAAWWRTRETKADATLRQQAKLIDFLQAKVEEADRKKCSLSNKLFGRSGRRTPASPPLRKANRELREEVERLRAKVSVLNGSNCPPTPRKEPSKQKTSFKGRKSNDSANGDRDEVVTIVWGDGSRESMRARCVAGRLQLRAQPAAAPLAARLHAPHAANLPHGDANRAFVIRLDESPRDREVAVVCGSVAERAAWLAKLSVSSPPASPAAGYQGRTLCTARVPPNTALYLANDAVVIGGPNGLQSLRGPIRLECSLRTQEVSQLAACGGRALLVAGAVWAAGGAALASAARRASALEPALSLAPVTLPDSSTPHLLVAMNGDSEEAHAAVGSGRRVFVLRLAAAEAKVARSLTVDRPPHALLLTPRALYIAGEKPLKINLPSGALEAFAMDEPIIAAAARKHSAPRAILLIRENPVEILLCYSELGVFLDENGKRTRNEDPKWSAAVHAWAFVHPFLYVIGEDKLTVVCITEEVYKTPPCTCDTTSLASTTSDCYMPQVFNMKIQESYLLGTTPNGIILRSNDGDQYRVSVMEGMAAFKSVGASVESLETNPDIKSSSTDLAQSLTDLSEGRTPQDTSQDSIEETTGFLADIRKRAQQLRNQNRKEQNRHTTSDDVIKNILMTEVGIKRGTNGRKSPETSSEFDSDSTETDEQRSSKDTADVCAEMFARQVRFE